MPNPIQTQNFVVAGGDHEDIGVLSLADIYSSADSKNVRIDKAGEIKKVLGYAQFGTGLNGLITDTGGNATDVQGLFQYGESGLLGVFKSSTEVEFWSWADADLPDTFVFERDLGNIAIEPPDAAPFGTDLFVTLGQGTPQVFNGSTVVDAGGTVSPTFTSSTAGSAGNPSGTYEFKLVSMIGNERQIGGPVSTAVQVENKQIDLQWTADTNSLVTGYELYATSGTGKEFYFAQYVDLLATASVTYDLLDKRLVRGRPLDEHGEAPADNMYFVEPHRNRMWWGRTDALDRRLWWSSPNDPDSVGTNNFFDLPDPLLSGDVITGMTGDVNDSLIVWMERSVYRVSGSGTIIAEGIPDFRLERTNASIGCVSHRSVVKVPSGAKYTTATGETAETSASSWAYFSPKNTIHLFDGDNDVVISYPKHEFLQTDLSRPYYTERKRIWAEHDAEESEVTWYFPLASAGNDDVGYGLRWNYKWGTWAEITNTPFRCGAVISTDTSQQIILTGETSSAVGGFVYINKQSSRYVSAGADIDAEWWTKPLLGVDENGGPLIAKSKRWRRLNIVTGAQASALLLTVEWFDGYANGSATAEASLTVNQSGTNLTHVQTKVLLKDSGGDYLVSRAMRLKFSDDSDDAAWSVPGFSLGYQVLPGERGR